MRKQYKRARKYLQTKYNRSFSYLQTSYAISLQRSQYQSSTPRIVIVHIPKNGGTSLSSILLNSTGHINLDSSYLAEKKLEKYHGVVKYGHFPVERIKNFVQRSGLKNPLFVSVVRNPYMRALIIYNYSIQKNKI